MFFDYRFAPAGINYIGRGSILTSQNRHSLCSIVYVCLLVTVLKCLLTCVLINIPGKDTVKKILISLLKALISCYFRGCGDLFKNRKWK